MIKVYDLENCIKSEKDGDYRGNAGLKEGVLIDGKPWMVKYPKNTREMKNVNISYTTAPLSEFVGSHIYDILGYDVHETILGVRHNKLVVACKDFCVDGKTLMELSSIRNMYNEEIERALSESSSSTDDSHFVNLEPLLLQIEHNEVLSKIDGVKERFWDCAVIDILINNNDRNNGNWGVIRDGGNYTLAPVFDNGAAFYNKIDVAKMDRLFDSPAFADNIANSIQTAYALDGKLLSAKKFLQLEEEGLKQAIMRVTPKIVEKLLEIEKFIRDIPENYGSLVVMPAIQKEYYVGSMKAIMDKLIEPKYNDLMSRKEVAIPFDKKHVSAIEDKFEPDKLFYTIRLPKGFMLNGEDVSGCTIHPKEVRVVAGDPDKLLAVYHKEGNAPVMINLQREGNLIGQINAEDLKAAADAYDEKAVDQQVEKAAERQSNIESVIQEDRDDEIE